MDMTRNWLKEKLGSFQPLELLMLSVLVVLLTKTMADPDLWGHLRFGLDILQSGSIVTQDPYSYIPSNQYWINHEWLSEVLFSSAWLVGKSIGLIIIKTLIGMIIFVIAYLYLIRIQTASVRIFILMILSFFLMLPFLLPLRPHIFTILFFELLLLVIIQAEEGDFRWLWASPIFMLFWVNMHGGFLAGLAVFIVWSILHLIFNWRDYRYILPPLVFAFLVTLFNPYGYELIIFLLRTATVPRPEINDWQPLRVLSVLGIPYLLTLALSILGWVFSHRSKKIPLLIIFSILAISPLVAIRHLQLYNLAFLLLAGEHILDAWSRFRPTNQILGKPSKFSWGFALITSLALLVWALPLNSRIYIPSSPSKPIEAVDFLGRSGVSGNLVTYYEWGEYIIWHLSPGIRVSIDGRRETVYSDEIYAEYLDFNRGTRNWDAIVDNYDSHMALVEINKSSYNLLRIKPGWKLIYEDSIAALFVQDDWSQGVVLEQLSSEFKPAGERGFFP